MNKIIIPAAASKKPIAFLIRRFLQIIFKGLLHSVQRFTQRSTVRPKIQTHIFFKSPAKGRTVIQLNFCFLREKFRGTSFDTEFGSVKPHQKSSLDPVRADFRNISFQKILSIISVYLKIFHQFQTPVLTVAVSRQPGLLRKDRNKAAKA